MTDIKISPLPLNIDACINAVLHSGSGGIDVFIGTVRDTTKGKAVVALDFEAYEPMALREMTKIAEDAITQWPVNKMVIHHRTGRLLVGEVAVIIAVIISGYDCKAAGIHPGTCLLTVRKICIADPGFEGPVL